MSNKDIDKYKLLVKYKRLINIKSEKYYITWTIDLGLNSIFTDKSSVCNESLVFNYEKLIDVDKKVMDELHKKFINISIWEKGFFSNDEISNAKIMLDELETNCSFEGVIDF